MHRLFLALMMAIGYMLVGAQDEYHGAMVEYFPQAAAYEINLRWDLHHDNGWDADIDAGVQAIHDNGNRLIIGTRATPEPYRLYPAYLCSQPKVAHYSAYVDWLSSVIERYQPWAVEIWNEPDVVPSAVSADNWFFGCWDSGYDYGLFVAYVHQQIKSLYPDVKIISGALMLNVSDMYQRKFVVDMLSAPNFQADYISFHCYPYKGTNAVSFCSQKTAYLQTLTDIKIFMSEFSLLTNDSCTDLDYLAQKAAAIRDISLKAPEMGLAGWLVYPMGWNNWMCSDLLDGGGTPGQPYREWIKNFVLE